MSLQYFLAFPCEHNVINKGRKPAEIIINQQLDINTYLNVVMRYSVRVIMSVIMEPSNFHTLVTLTVGLDVAPYIYTTRTSIVT